MWLNDKWESLSLIDIISVIFVYSTGAVNVTMMIIIYFNIDCLHFIQSTMKLAMFRPKSQAQADEAKKWKRVARMFQKAFFGNNVIVNICGISLGIVNPLCTGRYFLLVRYVCVC
nr:unnamed protein product [Callosobruchus analis]